ncbi:MAG: cytidylate kinase-like family protein [Planctomycetaceae bacterium]|nr:cytidylate kinase-like family protein [Planctomycetaceae bacterium]
MMTQIHQEPHISAAAERQMHAWAITGELKDRAMRRERENRSARHPIRFVTISREAGANGSEIGRRVGEVLGWRVFDKNLLDCIADRFQLPRIMLDLVDETRSNWVYDVLGTWMDRKLVPHEKFVACLIRVVTAAARGERAVFVGRAAQFLLPRPELLAVRLVASPKYRIQQIREEFGLNESDARRQMHELDVGRQELAQRFFHHDITDPHLYDLVINVERCGKLQAAEEIVAAVAQQPAIVA